MNANKEDEKFRVAFTALSDTYGLSTVFSNCSKSLMRSFHPLDHEFEVAVRALKLILPKESMMTLKEIKTIILKAKVMGLL